MQTSQGGVQGSNPFSKAAASGAAARRRREMQQAMKDTLEIAKANEAAKEQAKKKEEEKARQAAARAELTKKPTALEQMELDSSDESNGEDLEAIVRVLDKEAESSPLRKWSRGRKTQAVVTATPPALRQSSFVPHQYTFP